MAVGVGVSVGIGVFVGVSVTVGVSVAVGVGVAVGVDVNVGVGDDVGGGGPLATKRFRIFLVAWTMPAFTYPGRSRPQTHAWLPEAKTHAPLGA